MSWATARASGVQVFRVRIKCGLTAFEIVKRESRFAAYYRMATGK